MKVTIELNRQEAVLLEQMLNYVDSELEDAPDEGASIIHPNALKQVIQHVNRQVDEQTK